MDITTIFSSIVVPLAAIGGLILSVFNRYYQWKESKPNISLEFFDAGYFNDPTLEEHPPYTGYVLVIKNLGKVDLIIDSTGFKWKNGKFERKFYGVDLIEKYQEFPYKFVPGSTFFIEFPLYEIRKEIFKNETIGSIKISGFIKDGYGKYYTSLPFEVNVTNKKEPKIKIG